MRYTLLFFILVLFLGTSCRNDDNGPEPPTSLVSDISTDDIRSFLPHELFEGVSIVYRNKSGAEKTLVPVFSESTILLEVMNVKYNLNRFEIDFIDSIEPLFGLTLDGAGNWADEQTKLVYLSVFLMLFNFSGHTVDNISFENKIADTSQFSNYKKEVEYFGKTFSDVYVFIGTDNNQVPFQSYSQVDVNSENGIVAFKDHENELWIFDRFE